MTIWNYHLVIVNGLPSARSFWKGSVKIAYYRTSMFSAFFSVQAACWWDAYTIPYNRNQLPACQNNPLGAATCFSALWHFASMMLKWSSAYYIFPHPWCTNAVAMRTSPEQCCICSPRWQINKMTNNALRERNGIPRAWKRIGSSL